MARSYKSIPGYSDRDPKIKKKYNRALRRESNTKATSELEDYGCGSGYKRRHDSRGIKEHSTMYRTHEEVASVLNQEDGARKLHKLQGK